MDKGNKATNSNFSCPTFPRERRRQVELGDKAGNLIRLFCLHLERFPVHRHHAKLHPAQHWARVRACCERGISSAN